MSFGVLSIVLLLLAIGLITGSVMYTKSNDFTDTNTQQSCNDALVKDLQNYKEGGQCHVWDGSQCRKGEFQNDRTCVSKGKIIPVILLGVGGFCLLASIWYGVMYMRS
jgi:hypothetical protein